MRRGRRESEGTTLAVAAHRPALAGMHDAATELVDPRERCFEVCYLEVGERHGVAGTTAAAVDAECRSGGLALPATALIWGPWRELKAEDTAPKAQGAIGVVGGKLDQREREVVHWDTIASLSAVVAYAAQAEEDEHREHDGQQNAGAVTVQDVPRE